MNAVAGSTRLLLAAFAGFIHALIPGLFPFYTSTEIIRLFRNVLVSGRHDNEVLTALEDVCVVVSADSSSPLFLRADRPDAAMVLCCHANGPAACKRM